MIKTDRLLLRQWQEVDFIAFADMCSDKRVMKFFPKTQTTSESYEIAKKIQSLIKNRGWGLWAVEVPKQDEFIGFVGLHTLEEGMPFSPCVEISWRLAYNYWGKGYATEAAKAVLEYAFNRLNLDEVVSFTALANARSMAVMKKIGMQDDDKNFMHPNVEVSHSLCEHVLYKISYSKWKENTA